MGSCSEAKRKELKSKGYVLFVLSFALSLCERKEGGCSFLGGWKEEGGEKRHENVESRGITGRV